jgi:hypothetical protein
MTLQKLIDEKLEKFRKNIRSVETNCWGIYLDDIIKLEQEYKTALTQIAEEAESIGKIKTLKILKEIKAKKREFLENKTE